jgi:hypothetical protein
LGRWQSQVRPITEQLHATFVNADELAIVLQEFFPRAQWDPESRAIHHMTEDEELSLVVEYTKSGQVAKIEATDAVDPGVIDEIAWLVEAELISGQGSFTRREVLFSLDPVTHCYRHGDSWQILPAPTDAPQPQARYTAHPFLIEMQLPTSPLHEIRMSRAQKRLWTLHLVLSLLLNGGIERASYAARHHWVLDWEAPEGPMASRYLQESYTYPSLAYEPPRFSEVGDIPPMRAVPDREYFARVGIDGSSMTMPACLPSVFDRLETAPQDVRSRFIRACYWLDRSSAAWHLSASLGYVSLVNSIETLVRPGPREECPHCHKDLGPGPTRLFREFVDKHASGAEGESRARLYNLRSDLVHGEHILRRDRPGWAQGFEPATLKQENLAREMRSIARVSILNWFQAETTTSVTDPA